ncbi:MAG: leucine--tRNA ligase [Planctomycetota bacterium]|jgi:leucyl-tRNA synthetase
MVEEFDHKNICEKWQKRWSDTGVFNASDDTSAKKFYVLIEFPYPSGDGLHVGHPRSYSALDVIARKRRMEGFNVIYPIGFDAFGLPTENFALKTGEHPRTVTKRNVGRYRRQLQSLGFSFDWSREVNTTDPEYYKWTQWIFLKLFEHGLAYKSEMPINWCLSCKVGLANEEVVGGACERCGGEVVRRVRSQWMLKITQYAEQLLQGLDEVDFLDRIKTQQITWIGKSHGADVDFTVAGSDEVIRVYTTRPDTLFGATYMVLAPEHPFVAKFADRIENADEVRAYRDTASKKSEFERTELAKEISGVEMKGLRAVNPVNGEEIPVWVSDYVLISYGTGAIMAVPGHDERDWRFAKHFGLPIVEVIAGGDIEKGAFVDIENGTLVNSGILNGLGVRDAITEIIEFLKNSDRGEPKVNYKLRDWVFSRQRYWGEPIPVVKCESCGWVPLPYSELPLTLPDVEGYQTTDTGESPLALLEDWLHTTCPNCGGSAKRETDTMPQWAGSSWYFLRYCDPHNDEALASKEAMEYWTPVDWYNGGMEHTTLHLLYSRFWHRFLHDIGVTPTPEPYARRTSHGMVLGEGGEKMSKSLGNVVNPDDMVARHGADAFRCYELFMGAFDQAIPWSTQGLIGQERFIVRVWNLLDRVVDDAEKSTETERLLHQTTRDVSERIEAMKFNTALASLMTLSNHLGGLPKIGKGDFERFVLLLSPFAPHVCEEIWERLGHDAGLARHPWPSFDEALAADEMVEIPVQVNGKLRGKLAVPHATPEDRIREAALELDNVAKFIEGSTVKKVIIVRGGKLVNIVVGK